VTPHHLLPISQTWNPNPNLPPTIATTEASIRTITTTPLHQHIHHSRTRNHHLHKTSADLLVNTIFIHELNCSAPPHELLQQRAFCLSFPTPAPRHREPKQHLNREPPFVRNTSIFSPRTYNTQAWQHHLHSEPPQQRAWNCVITRPVWTSNAVHQ